MTPEELARLEAVEAQAAQTRAAVQSLVDYFIRTVNKRIAALEARIEVLEEKHLADL